MGTFRNKILQCNLECAPSPTFSRKYSKISLENPDKRNITYNLEIKFHSKLFMSDSSAPVSSPKPHPRP